MIEMVSYIIIYLAINNNSLNDKIFYKKARITQACQLNNWSINCIDNNFKKNINYSRIIKKLSTRISAKNWYFEPW
jgi:hypothetical protein